MADETRELRVKTLAVGPIGTNCYLVSDPETRETVVIDPGDEAERILATVAELGGRVVAIVNTHGHWDHIGANGRLKAATGAPLLIHRDDAAWLGLTQTRAGSGFRLPHTVQSPPADRLLKDGDEVVLGKRSLRVIHTPGHTPGGLCLHTPGLLFSGDTLFAESVGRTDLPGGSLSALVTSIRAKLFCLPEETVVYPGHGPSTTIGDEKSLNPYV